MYVLMYLGTQICTQERCVWVYLCRSVGVCNIHVFTGKYPNLLLILQQVLGGMRESWHRHAKEKAECCVVCYLPHATLWQLETCS